MADNTDFKNMIRIGKIQSVDAVKMTARVKFEDKGGIVSGALQIIKRPMYIVPAENSKAFGQTAAMEVEFDYNDTLTEKSHSHKAYVTNWVPDVGQMVLCIMIVDGDGDGFVIGGI